MNRLIIQPDWDEFFRDETQKKDAIWIQFKNSETSSINENIHFDAYQKEEKILNSCLKIENISKENNSLDVTHKENIISTRFIAPVFKFALHYDDKKQKQPVYNIDITENGLGVSSSSNGSLYIWTLEDGSIRRDLSGHIGDIYVSAFFPSGMVVLSGGLDMRIKIWSVENGKSPVMLGHSSCINDVCIVDKGRNIVTVCSDGMCRLWDLGESNCLETFENCDCPINSCSIISISPNNAKLLPATDKLLSNREIGTGDKLLSIACEDGYLKVIALQSRKKIFEYKCESAVNCCCFLDDLTIACGTQNGYIYTFNIFNNKVLNSWKEFRSAILKMKKFEPTQGLIITTGDGSCFIRDLNKAETIIELTGPDCDHVYNVAYNASHVYTCCRDGFIRKYDINHILKTAKESN